MTIKERLEKLQYLSGAAISGWIDNIFSDINRYPTHWWQFNKNGITKVNLERANKFWKEVYKVYNNGELDRVYNKTFRGDCMVIIRELEKEIKK